MADNAKSHPMREIKIEKVLLSAGGKDAELEKSRKLLELLSQGKPQVIASTRRIPDFKVRPGLEVGTRVTLRGKKAIDLLKRLLVAIDNKLKQKQIEDNHFSFGIKEYIEIPEMKYQREIGIKGLNVTVVFTSTGIRVKRKKIRTAKIPKKQQVLKQEIIDYLQNNFKTTVTGGKK